MVLTIPIFMFSLAISQLMAKAIPVRGAKFRKACFQAGFLHSGKRIPFHPSRQQSSSPIEPEGLVILIRSRSCSNLRIGFMNNTHSAYLPCVIIFPANSDTLTTETRSQPPEQLALQLKYDYRRSYRAYSSPGRHNAEPSRFQYASRRR